jgi:hypothetical protein
LGKSGKINHKKESTSRWNEGWPTSGSKERTYNGFFGIEWWELEYQL